MNAICKTARCNKKEEWALWSSCFPCGHNLACRNGLIICLDQECTPSLFSVDMASDQTKIHKEWWPVLLLVVMSAFSPSTKVIDVLVKRPDPILCKKIGADFVILQRMTPDQRRQHLCSKSHPINVNENRCMKIPGKAHFFHVSNGNFACMLVKGKWFGPEDLQCNPLFVECHDLHKTLQSCRGLLFAFQLAPANADNDGWKPSVMCDHDVHNNEITHHAWNGHTAVSSKNSSWEHHQDKFVSESHYMKDTEMHCLKCQAPDQAVGL